MPILAPPITAAILTAGAGLTGSNFLALASAVGQAVSIWAKIPTSVVMTGVVTGSVGAGVVAGKLFVTPSPLPLPASVLGAGFAGPTAPQIAVAIGLGVSNSLNATAGYRGVSTGALGNDVSKVIFADPTSLTGLLVSSMGAFGLVGPQAPLLASGLASGIAAMLLTGTGTGVATGAPGPLPGTGISRSSLI